MYSVVKAQCNNQFKRKTIVRTDRVPRCGLVDDEIRGGLKFKVPPSTTIFVCCGSALVSDPTHVTELHELQLQQTRCCKGGYHFVYNNNMVLLVMPGF
jgi:hypothetical protein